MSTPWSKEGETLARSKKAGPTLQRVVEPQTDTIKGDLPKGIGRPALNALLASGFTSLEQLTQISEAQLLAIHRVGPKAVGILRAELEARGLAFKS